MHAFNRSLRKERVIFKARIPSRFIYQQITDPATDITREAEAPIGANTGSYTKLDEPTHMTTLYFIAHPTWGYGEVAQTSGLVGVMSWLAWPLLLCPVLLAPSGVNISMDMSLGGLVTELCYPANCGPGHISWTVHISRTHLLEHSCLAVADVWLYARMPPRS